MPTSRSRIATATAVVVLLAACGKKEEPPKPAPAPKVAAAPAAPAAPPNQTPPIRRNLPDPPPPPPVSVDNLFVGKTLGADGRVDPAAGSISPGDTIYASVETSGAGEVALKARWNHIAEGKANLVTEEVRPLKAAGPGVQRFELKKPGMQPGDYQVEIFVNERAAATRRFGVN